MFNWQIMQTIIVVQDHFMLELVEDIRDDLPDI